MSRFYRELADWWPLLSAPEDYVEEAAFYASALERSSERPVHTVLELGSGGGNNASHMKERFDLTLVDISPEMLEVSRRLNPGCEHVEGDMRSVRLGRTFDAVFVHDAVDYMTTLDDLRAAAHTAFTHCAPGGAALFVPDDVRESFRPDTSHGGHDGEGRALRYLAWSWDPDPDDSITVTDYIFALRSADGSVETVHDRHLCGLFTNVEWIAVLEEVGFDAERITYWHSEAGDLPVFVGRRPEGTPR